METQYKLPGVLVVDDDKDFVEETSDTLRMRGWDARAVTSAADALSYLESETHNIGVVVSDLYMPEVSGVRLARELQARLGDSRPEMILISGHPSMETLFTAIRLQVVDFLPKPLSSGELVGSVELAVARLRRRIIGSRIGGTGLKADKTGAQQSSRHNQIDPLKLLLDVNQTAMDYLEKDQLDYQQMRILVDIAWNDRMRKPVSVTGLAYGLNLPAATSHRKLKDLEARGLIQRHADEDDGRLTYVCLTEQGNLAVEKLAGQISKKLTLGGQF